MDVEDAYERELRSERDLLLDAFAAVNGPATLLDFQLRLAAAIESHEPAAFRQKSPEAKEHLRLLRLLGDGLAWRFLHPYAIRQLAKNPAPPPALGSQGRGFRKTLEVAEQLAAAGGLVLIADLSHCLTIGDLVVCNDRERPSIVECGGHKQFVHKGRKGRQFKRAQAVIDLLTDGTALFPGNVLPTRTLELETAPEHVWPVVDRVVGAAVRNGSATELCASDDLIFAVRADTDVDSSGALGRLTSSMAEPVVAVYTRVLERPDSRVPPCVAWDISLEAKRLLFQGDVFLGHVIDAASFVGRRSGDAAIVKVLRAGEAITGFGVRVGNDPVAFSQEHLTDVLLGFATIGSTADAMLEAAQQTIATAEEWVGTDESDADDSEWLANLADEDGFVSPALAWTQANSER